MLKRSKQREAILQELCARTDHPTAEELYLSLKQRMPALSLGTVYRNLSLLSDEGIILKLTCGGADHFDGNAAQHYHFLCESCGKLFDVHMPIYPDLEEIACENSDFHVTNHRLTFYGICPACME